MQCCQYEVLVLGNGSESEPIWMDRAGRNLYAALASRRLFSYHTQRTLDAEADSKNRWRTISSINL